MANAKRESRWLIVFEAPKENPSADTLRGYEATLLGSLDFSFVATIIHDKDFTEEGEPRKAHLHAFIELPQGKTLGQLLTSLESTLKCAREQISAQPSNSEILGVQYLTHKNHPNKHAYDISEVKSNNNELLLDRWGKEYEKPQSEAEIVLGAIIEASSLLELSKTIGIDKANKFRPTFNQIKQEQQQDLEGMRQRLSRLKSDLEAVLDAFEKYLKEDLDPLAKRNLAETEKILNWVRFFRDIYL